MSTTSQKRAAARTGRLAHLVARLVVALAVPALLAPASPLAAGPPGAEEEAPAAAAETAPSFPRVEVHGLVDVRIAATGDQTAWTEGGFGRTRYGGPDHDNDGRADASGTAFHAGQLSLVVDGRVCDDLLGHVHINADVDEGRRDTFREVGVVEAFVAWTPVLSSGLRARVRGGITIPPFSLEHPEVAWSTRYSITPSAIGSWIGEELKSTGAEGTVIFSLPSFSELEIQGAAFSGNDPAGALLAWRGWALHDRQAQTNDELPLPSILSLTDERFFIKQGLRTDPFREVDSRVGYHAQARLRVGAHAMVQGVWYDNRGDVTSIEPGAYTWNTRFGVVGTELNLGPVTLLGQFLDGRAKMGFETPRLVNDPFRAGYFMGSVLLSRTRLTGRYDRFSVDDEDPWKEGKDLNTEDGWAGTVALMQGFGDHHGLEVEYLHVYVEHPFAVTAGERADRTDRQFQLGYRLRF